ncbi:uncharacterized protein LOC114523978 isoform X2 [Dendronephthya gigantea]|uniref:uncharacterized protein LOC114523978 isoform X2 n=1 Tax=Dendronephthya gigantea TaxID=151771 RepID=UPI001068E54C|nr:uncharacterized protein LOC114523978 isoform X2 [Dendronephthya gigantea]
MTREILENLDKRQRVKPKIVDPKGFRRGNVPKYISFVEPMPVHQRPGTAKSSGYSSCGISMVTEDLLVSAGTQEELADSGEESGTEVDIGFRNILPSDGLDPRKDDVDDASQEAQFSSRSSLLKSELDGSFLDGEGSNMDDGEEEGNTTSSVDQDVFASLELQNAGEGLSGSDIDANASDLLGESALDNGKGNADGDSDAGRQGDDTGVNIYDQYDGSVDGKSSGLDESGALKSEDDINKSLQSDQQNPDDAENSLDGNSLENGTPSDELDASQNNQQVTFSEPLTTDRRSSSNVGVEDAAGTESPKSILKGSDKNRIFEHELDSSIMKRLTSPEETDGSLSKTTMERRSADLRPQSKPDLQAQFKDKQLNFDGAEQTSSDEEGQSDSDLYSSTGRRRPKPKGSIYGKRANMKAPRQKIRRKKDSENSEGDDTILCAESALLMEQILEQEKRLREGMKPWLKGRLALSQQNSRFEIPMDVRLLETMTPMEYLTKYCIISKRRKALYKHVFQKVDKNRDGLISFTELETGLKDVHTGILDSEHVENIVELVLIDREGEFNIKQFSAVAAFSERITCKDQLPVELLNSFDGQKEIIESADFFALSWKLDGIKVNPDVKKILDSL